jgi:hypothetical protein
MELDDLKQTWKQNPVNKIKNTDIMELIQHKSYGPVEALKREFKKQIMVFTIIVFVQVLVNLDNVPGLLQSILFWSYVVFCAGVIVFSYQNFLIARKMEIMDGNLKQNIETQINILERRMERKIIALRLAMVFFIVLVEVLPYFQHYRSLNLWHSASPYIRFSAYAFLLILQYFMSRRVTQKKIGDHINYLKNLIKEME